MKSISDYHFKNWAGNFKSRPQNYFQPHTEEELVEIIRCNDKIRFTGTGHSWSSICVTDETLVNLDLYNKVLELNTEKLQLTVQPGIKLWQLNEFLDKENLALANLGSISKQSLAGAISTGTHGSGINFQILASQIVEFKLIKANGEKIILHKERDKELFNLCVVSLGAIGVISEITLNVVPAFRLHDQTFVMKFEDTVERLDEFVNETDHFKLWWFPHVDSLVVYRYTRTPQLANDSRFRQWFMDEFLSVNMYRLFLKIGNINREWRKNINHTLVTKFIQPLNRIEKSYKVFNVPEPPVHRETEWGFDLKHAKELLREYKKMIDASSYRINFIQEIRFTRGDEYALSPCYGRNTIWLGAYNADNFLWNELLSDFEQLAKQFNGRPHWGKEFNADAAYISAQYAQWNVFNNLRKEFDPTGKFANDYILELFPQ